MSFEVKLITLLTSIILTSIAITLFFSSKSFLIQLLATIGVVFVFFLLLSKSVKNITIKNNQLILNYRIGKKNIDFQDIVSINKLDFNNLTMTLGSQGVFGFNGNLMDNSRASVNNRKNMIGIETKKTNYIVSIDNVDKSILYLKQKI